MKDKRKEKENLSIFTHLVNTFFLQGTLVKSVQNGQFILLDEINLAPSETLESLSGLLEGNKKGRRCNNVTIRRVLLLFVRK